MFFKGNAISVAFSPDGIHWGAGIACPEANVEGDTHNNVLWAPTRNEYVGITRTWAAPRGRQVARTASQDFLNWRKAEVVLEGLEDHLQTYAMPTFYHGGVYLGLVAMFNTQTDRVHTELAWSPDTMSWQRVDAGQSLIPNSQQDGAYDWGCVYAAAYPIFEKDHIRLYYGGSDGPHFGYRKGSLCLAILRPDGFAGYVPLVESTVATITTKLVQPKGTLSINADVKRDGFVTIRLLGESGKQLARSLRINQPVIEGAIEWRNGFRMSEIVQPVKLEFEFTRAKLYSFRWR